jgi:hypothetical protein
MRIEETTPSKLTCGIKEGSTPLQSGANFTPGYGTLPGDRSLFDWASTPRWYSPRGHTRTELTAA